MADDMDGDDRDERDERDDELEQDDAERDVVAEADAMADALEDELADVVTHPARKLPATLAIPAVILSAAIAAPLTPDGYSFAQILYVAFLRHPLEGLITLLGFGSPFCFGILTLALVAARDHITPSLGERLLVANLSFLHAQLLLVAGLLVARGQGMLPAALLGFAIVSGGFFIIHHARSSAMASVDEDRPVGPSQRWLVRWGSTVIVAVCGWMRLQVLIDVRLGWAVELVLGACVMMAVLLSKPRDR
jgi:hypothetical protein